MTNNSTYMRPVIPAGNSFYINIALDKFIDGAYTEFDLTKATDLKVYLICATHNTEIPLDYEIIPGIDNVLRCFVDYRLLHTTSYGIAVEGYDEHDIHFRFLMLPKEGFLVVNNTSGMKVTDDVQVIDISGRVGWGIQTEGDLSNYYTKAEVDNLIAEIEVDLSDYYTKEEISQLLTLYPTRTEINERFNNYYTKTVVDNLLTNKQDELVSGTNIKTINSQSLLGSGNIVIEGTEQLQADWTQTDTSAKDYIKHKPTIPASQVQSDWNETDTTAVDYIKNKPTIPAAQVNSDWNATSGVAKILNKPDLNNYATKTDLNNYYDKGETDGLLNNKVDVSTLNSDYYNKNTVDNLLDAKADTSDLAQVATSGSYNDLSNKPDLTQYATHTELNTKQDTLVSGTNIKTINNESILGSGNINIDAENNDEVTANALYDINQRLSEAEFGVKSIPQDIDAKIVPVNERINEVSNDVIDLTNDIDNTNLANSLILNELHNEIDDKQDELVSGTNIKTVNGTSLLGSGDITVGGGFVPLVNGTKTGLVSSLATNYNTNIGQAATIEGDSDGINGYKPNTASGDYSHVEGSRTMASNKAAHAEGYQTTASGNCSHAEGQSTTASKICAHAEGNSTTASGEYSHSEGGNTIASGNFSHAEGSNSEAQATYSHAEGYYAIAKGQFSHAEGNQTETNNQYEHAQGKFNISSKANNNEGDSGNTLSSIGNGIFSGGVFKHNAFEVRQNGDIYYSDTEKIDGSTVYYYTAPMRKLQDAMVTSITNGLKIETASSAPSGTVPVTLAFDSTTNTLYIVQ